MFSDSKLIDRNSNLLDPTLEQMHSTFLRWKKQKPKYFCICSSPGNLKWLWSTKRCMSDCIFVFFTQQNSRANDDLNFGSGNTRERTIFHSRTRQNDTDPFNLFPKFESLNSQIRIVLLLLYKFSLNVANSHRARELGTFKKNLQPDERRIFSWRTSFPVITHVTRRRASVQRQITYLCRNDFRFKFTNG